MTTLTEIKEVLLRRKYPERFVVQPEPQPVTTYTKLQIRRALRSLELEASLDALLDANELFRKEWADAIEIDLNDPLTIQAIEAMQVDVSQVIEAIGS